MWARKGEIVRTVIKEGQTRIRLLCEERFVPLAAREVRRLRRQLFSYIEQDPAFYYSLLPCRPLSFAPEIVRRMCEASAKVGVGPMAAVAGAIAELLLEALIAEGAEHVVVENGGDIAMLARQPVVVGIYTGDRKTSRFALKIPPSEKPVAVCTSSARIGPSLSFGIADACVVVADSAALADAAATALGNAVFQEHPSVLEKAIASVLEEGVRGAMVFCGQLIATGGELPDIVRAEFAEEIESRRVIP